MEAAVSANILKKILSIFRFIRSLKEMAFNERKCIWSWRSDPPSVVSPGAQGGEVSSLRGEDGSGDGSGDRALAPTATAPVCPCRSRLARERGRDRFALRRARRTSLHDSARERGTALLRGGLLQDRPRPTHPSGESKSFPFFLRLLEAGGPRRAGRA